MKASRPPVRKKTASSVPEQALPEPGPALDSATEIPHRPDTAPAEIGSLPDGYPTPQPEAGRRTKSHTRKWRKSRLQQEDQEASKLQQPSDPTPENVDQAKEPDDAEVGSKASGDGPNSPKGEIIDLTIKEESPPAQVSGSNEGAPGLRAGCVRFVVFYILELSDKILGPVLTLEHYITIHRHQEAVFDHRRGD